MTEKEKWAAKWKERNEQEERAMIRSKQELVEIFRDKEPRDIAEFILGSLLAYPMPATKNYNAHIGDDRQTLIDSLEAYAEAKRNVSIPVRKLET